MRTPLLLEELNPTQIQLFLDLWKKSGRDDLISAHKKGKQVVVGELYDETSIVVED